MADTTSKGAHKPGSDDEILSAMRKHLDTAIAFYAPSRRFQLMDLKFFAGNSDNRWQWPDEILASRTATNGETINARPCLTVNSLPQHVYQVTNDQRQNRPAGKVIPADDGAEVEVAEILDGVVRHIEYISDADVAYDTANENQVIHGEGYWRILTEYEDDESFDQEIKIKQVANPFSVYMDVMVQDPCGQDARWGFILDDMTHDEFERAFPDASPISSLKDMGVGDTSASQWVNEKTVRIAEYFYVDEKPATLNLYPGNQTAIKDSPQDTALRKAHKEPLSSRKTTKSTVKWIKTNGYEILDSKDWAGKHIPIIRVIGSSLKIDGEVQTWGLVRNAKDPQRMYNYWASQEAEMLALAPKAPFIGASGQFEGYESKWQKANVENYSYLEYNPSVTEDGSPVPPPQRSQPPMAQIALIQAKSGSLDDIKMTTGQYNASLGQQSNERSGKAILERQHEGDVGTYHFVDNLARAVRYSTRQIVDLVPKIYDTQRMLRIVRQNGDVDKVKIDPAQPEPVKKVIDPQTNAIMERIYNPSVGKYDVCVSTGPGYATKRKEALESMAQLLQGNPELWKVAGDLFIKNMDWPGAQELAKRFEKTIDPKLLQNDDDPALQAARQQMQQMAQELDHMHQMLMNVPKSFEAREIMVKEFDAQIKGYEAETRRMVALLGAKNPQQGLGPEEIQEIVHGTLDAAVHSGDLGAALGHSAALISQQMAIPGVDPGQPGDGPPPDPNGPPGPAAPPQMPPQGAPNGPG